MAGVRARLSNWCRTRKFISGAALVGGIVGGTLWHLNNVFGFLFASRGVSYSRIYGSLGLVPVFMAGLYFSWLIVLFGAQVAYAFQNRRRVFAGQAVGKCEPARARNSSRCG